MLVMSANEEAEAAQVLQGQEGNTIKRLVGRCNLLFFFETSYTACTLELVGMRTPHPCSRRRRRRRACMLGAAAAESLLSQIIDSTDID